MDKNGKPIILLIDKLKIGNRYFREIVNDGDDFFIRWAQRACEILPIIKEIKTMGGEIDIIVTTIAILGTKTATNGIDLIKSLRKEFPSVSILVWTKMPKGITDKAIEAGANAVFKKFSDEEKELRKIILDIIANSSK